LIALRLNSLTEQRAANIGSLVLEKGGVIEECNVGYRVVGKLNANRSNVLVFPTWFGGTSQGMIELGVLQSGMYADPDHYHVVAIDALGNGVSSSPSQNPDNTMPEITIRDMVNSQYKLLTEVLGFDHINSLLGISMGGMQVYEWITAYPDFADNAVVVIATPKPSAADIYLWNYWRELAMALCELPNGERLANRMMAQAEGLAAFTPSFINASCSDGDPAVLREQALRDHAPLNTYNEISQLQAMLSHDISRNDDGNLAQAASRIRARLLTVTSRQDLTLSPDRPAQFARDTQTQHVELEGPMGHFAVFDEQQLPIALHAIHDFLRMGRL
jgi:homoserine O-acetyltransferase